MVNSVSCIYITGQPTREFLTVVPSVSCFYITGQPTREFLTVGPSVSCPHITGQPTRKFLTVVPSVSYLYITGQPTREFLTVVPSVSCLYITGHSSREFLTKWSTLCRVFISQASPLGNSQQSDPLCVVCLRQAVTGEPAVSEDTGQPGATGALLCHRDLHLARRGSAPGGLRGLRPLPPAASAGNSRPTARDLHHEQRGEQVPLPQASSRVQRAFQNRFSQRSFNGRPEPVQRLSKTPLAFPAGENSPGFLLQGGRNCR